MAQIKTEIITETGEKSNGLRNGIDVDNLRSEIIDSIDVAIHCAEQDGIYKSSIEAITITINR